MKLNTTNEKLIRVLLSANPVLAHYKGSARAVRLFFNMLGMKCKMSFDDNQDIIIQITNVTDKNLQPVKSMLAKQLQEILPINMIVKANNIVGIESDE